MHIQSTATHIISFPSPSLSLNLSARSCNQSGSSRRVVLECWRDLLLGFVVSGETVDTGLDQDEAELGVLVLAVGLQVLADGNRLLDEMPEILRDLRGKTYSSKYV